MPGSLPLTRISFSGTLGILLASGFSCCTPLLAATGSAWWNPASAQAVTHGVQRPPGNSSCSGFTNLSQSSGAPFDAGGISADTSFSCVPLGSTELDGAGLSAVAPVPAPSGFPLLSSPFTGAIPSQGAGASSSATAGSGSC
jgi:hypothetical protein